MSRSNNRRLRRENAILRERVARLERETRDLDAALDAQATVATRLLERARTEAQEARAREAALREGRPAIDVEALRGGAWW